MHSLFVALTLAAAAAPPPAIPALVDRYIERHFETYPGFSTQAGRHDRDSQLEDLTPARLAAWLAFNRETLQGLDRAAAAGGATRDDLLDAELLRGQVQREILALSVTRRPERDPLFWTSILEAANVYLLVRDDLPLAERLARVDARTRQVPRLAAQAQAALAHTDPKQIAPELCTLAAGQARSSALFYGGGLADAAAGEAIRPQLKADGAAASKSLDSLAGFLDGLCKRATGTPRLGSHYAAAFRWETGLDEDLAQVLSRAQGDFAAKRAEVAAYGRKVFKEVIAAEEPPADDVALVRRLFARVAEDADTDTQSYLANWKANVAAVEAFVRARGIITLPDPLTLYVSTSPSYFLSQSIGGVYPAGPYSPEAKTLFYLPVPPTDATSEQAARFFRDFNRDFNRMIAAHELIPGHYTQLKYAARHPHKVRALFPDGVFVEGWGTFCERLMLDEGWAGPLPRLAHLKKQLENIARTLVDIRVHTQGMTREQVLAFVKDEALQGDQLAGNMWLRSLTSPVQLTTYYLGYREVRSVYDSEKARLGDTFDLHSFMDSMMQLGPVPARHYKEH